MGEEGPRLLYPQTRQLQPIPGIPCSSPLIPQQSQGSITKDPVTCPAHGEVGHLILGIGDVSALCSPSPFKQNPRHKQKKKKKALSGSCDLGNTLCRRSRKMSPLKSHARGSGSYVQTVALSSLLSLFFDSQLLPWESAGLPQDQG